MFQLKKYVEDCRNLDDESFQKRCGLAFLILDGTADILQAPPTAPHKTLVMEASGGERAAISPQEAFLVFPLGEKKKEILDFFSVGRTERNDIYVPDSSLSIFHALFIRSQDGRFFLHDAGSANGSFVNEQAVPAQGKGSPVEVESGTRVRFGRVSFLFLKPAEFRSLVRGMTDKI